MYQKQLQALHSDIEEAIAACSLLGVTPTVVRIAKLIELMDSRDDRNTYNHSWKDFVEIFAEMEAKIADYTRDCN